MTKLLGSFAWDLETPRNGSISGSNLTVTGGVTASYSGNTHPQAMFDASTVGWPSPDGDDRVKIIWGRVERTYSSSDGAGIECGLQFGDVNGRNGYSVQYHEDGGPKAQLARDSVLVGSAVSPATGPDTTAWILVLIYNDDTNESNAWTVGYDSFSLPAGHVVGYVSTDDGVTYTRIANEAADTTPPNEWDGSFDVGVWAGNDFLTRPTDVSFSFFEAWVGELPFLDVVPPFLTGLDPAAGGQLIEGEPIILTVDDNFQVDDTKTVITAESSTTPGPKFSETVYTSGAFQTGWTESSVVASGSGSGYDFRLVRTAGFGSGQGVLKVTVHAEDTTGNVLDTSYIVLLPATSEESTFPHEIYTFIIKALRDCDQASDQLIQRWLDGPQTVFENLYAKIRSWMTVYDPEQTPSDALQHVRWIVGLTDSVVGPLGTLTDEESRRLISVATKVWKGKGTPSGFVTAARAVSARPVRYVDYFRFRTLSDEWEVDWANLDGDPWLVDAPGLSPSTTPDAVSDQGTFLRFEVDGLLGAAPTVSHDVRVWHVDHPSSLETRPSYVDGSGNNAVDTTTLLGQTGSPSTDVSSYRVGVDPDEYSSDLRVVDDGTLNRTLLEGMVALLRPAGERLFVRYLNFLDDFRDSFSWNKTSGTVVPDTDAGELLLSDASAETAIVTDYPGDASWTEVRCELQLKLESISLWGEVRFYYSDPDNFYAVRVNPGTPSVTLEKVTAGVRSVLDTHLLTVYHVGVYYTVHVAVDDTGSGHQIKYFLDGELLGSAVDVDHTSGKVGVAAEAGQDLTLTLVESYDSGLESTRIGPPPVS